MENIERNERNAVCFSSEIGNEFHYILKCTYFRNERKQVLLKFAYSRPNVIKLKFDEYRKYNNITKVLTDFFRKILVPENCQHLKKNTHIKTPTTTPFKPQRPY